MAELLNIIIKWYNILVARETKKQLNHKKLSAVNANGCHNSYKSLGRLIIYAYLGHSARRWIYHTVCYYWCDIRRG